MCFKANDIFKIGPNLWAAARRERETGDDNWMLDVFVFEFAHACPARRVLTWYRPIGRVIESALARLNNAMQKSNGRMHCARR